MRQALADGAWHSIRDLVNEYGELIAPESAIRANARDRKHLGLQLQDYGLMEIRGRSRLLAKAIREWAYKSGEVETRGEVGWREVRLTPKDATQ